MPWYRAALVWMLIMLAETGHGVVREVFIAPVIGDLRARQLGVLVGCVIIFVIAWLTARWMGAGTRRAQFTVGAFWVALTLVFEIALGRALGLSWARILSDYNPAHGGFMMLGLAFMFIHARVAHSRKTFDDHALAAAAIAAAFASKSTRPRSCHRRVQLLDVQPHRLSAPHRAGRSVPHHAGQGCADHLHLQHRHGQTPVLRHLRHQAVLCAALASRTASA